MTVEAHLVVILEDRLWRAEMRRRLEVVRMVALHAAELLTMLGKMHGALELFLDPAEVVGGVLLRTRFLARMAVIAGAYLLLEVRKGIETFDVTFLAVNIGMIGGLFKRYVDERVFFLAAERIGEDLGIARVTTNTLESLSILKIHDTISWRCGYQDSRRYKHQYDQLASRGGANCAAASRPAFAFALLCVVAMRHR